jgi:hypothetical protein
VKPYFHTIDDVKVGMEVFKSFNIKQTIAFGFLCLIVVSCSSYTPYRYSFSLIKPQNEILHNDGVGQAMSFEDSDVEFRFVPSPENIHVIIKNKSEHEINLVRDKAEYIDCSEKSRRIHIGDDYVEASKDFAMNSAYVAPVKIQPSSEMTGYVWINIWPDFGIGSDRTSITDAQINYLKESFFPRYSFEGSVEDLKSSTFTLILPIDFGEYVRDYTFTFKIDDVI